MNEGADWHPPELAEQEPAAPPERVARRAPAPAKPPHTRGRWLFAVVAFLPLVGGVAFGAREHYKAQRDVQSFAQGRRDFVPTVRVAQVRASDSTVTVTQPATTLAFEAANIFARASGYIETRKVDIGDHVKAGALLAKITAPELDHQIAQAQATLAQNQATLQQTIASRDLAQVTNERDGKLVQQGWVTLQQGDTDRLTLQAQQAAIGVAQSNVAAQQALLKMLGQQRDYLSVVAPFNGIITQRNIDNGSLVQAGSTFMFTLMQSDVIRVQVNVPQDAVFGLAPGVDALIRVPELPNQVFHGKVTRMANALAPGTRTLLTEIDIPNPDGVLSPGLYCTVELHIPRKAPSLIVPADAVVADHDGLHVVVLKNGKVHLQTVKVARDFGTEVEVRDGVEPGDTVVLNPMVELADGSRVKPDTTVAENAK
ncbi:MAG TPA: efflux RND transporter periplasmic adaptor subunit [Chloroflexota bacterium]